MCLEFAGSYKSFVFNILIPKQKLLNKTISYIILFSHATTT